MTFDQEWAELVAAAKDRQSVGMRLNQAQPGPGGVGNHDLVVHQDDLGAVGHEAYELHDVLRKKADIEGAGMDKSGSGSTLQAATELSAQNMTMGNELSTTVSVWGTQVKTVLQMCAHISNHLDYSKKAHAKDDEYLAASLRHRDGAAVPVSEISQYVK